MVLLHLHVVAVAVVAAQIAQVDITSRTDRHLAYTSSHKLPWNVRFTTSRCCSGVRRTKLTAYPETRMVSCGYFSGWSIASRSVARSSTLTFMWNPCAEV